NDIELNLFVPSNSQERDSETQAVFEKDCFYSVRDAKSNKCPLKISLVGIPQELPRIVANDENAIFNVMVNDYAGEEYNFTVKVVFPHLVSRFSHLKTIIRLQESLIFVVGQLEVINNVFYIYMKDFNFIDYHFLSKQKVFDSSSSRNSSEVSYTIRSKLLSIYRNITETSKEACEFKASREVTGKFSSDRSIFDYFNNFATTLNDVGDDELHSDEVINANKSVQSDDIKDSQIKRKRQRSTVNNNKKRRRFNNRSLRGTLRSSKPDRDVEIEKE
ncbi:5484_t:CDS:2, partial [Racocetra persica]